MGVAIALDAMGGDFGPEVTVPAASRAAYGALAERDQDALIEFLKSLQVLPPGTKHLVVDERGRPRPY